jgi:hypothetical protein
VFAGGSACFHKQKAERSRFKGFQILQEAASLNQYLVLLAEFLPKIFRFSLIVEVRDE